MSTVHALDHDSRDVADRYRVVVVMASFDLAFTLKRLLEMLGYAAEIATDGQAALELVISMQPDAVISAIELAGLDGFELASRIRDSVPSKPLMIANSSYRKMDIAEERGSVASIFSSRSQPQLRISSEHWHLSKRILGPMIFGFSTSNLYDYAVFQLEFGVRLSAHVELTSEAGDVAGIARRHRRSDTQLHVDQIVREEQQRSDSGGLRWSLA